MIEVIDNFLPEFYRKELETTLLGKGFPWAYLPETSSATDPDSAWQTKVIDGCVESPMFTHSFHWGTNVTERLSLIKPMLYYIEDKTGINATNESKHQRLKTNLMLKDKSFPEGCHNNLHCDVWSNKYVTVLYYVTDSDGDTIFFDCVEDGFKESRRVTPKANRAVIFNSSLYHTSTPPKLYDTRLVINLVFKNVD